MGMTEGDAERETITHSKALALARESTQLGLKALSRLLGHPIEPGQVDGDGVPFTRRRIGRIKSGLTRVGMGVLRDTYTIVPNGK